MPLHIENDYDKVSMSDLIDLMKDGYSIVKSPHVGNQHPSNLVCAKLGIPLSMVSFTSGERDKNFHPHLRIQNGFGEEITSPEMWTPFAKMKCGTSIENYHQSELSKRFPNLVVQTDMEIVASELELSETVFRTATTAMPDLWYRKVDSDGNLEKIRGGDYLDWDTVKYEIFRFSTTTCGWVIPNRAHIVLELALQSLSSGKDKVYHLAGPDMIGYIGKKQNGLSKAYDALRIERTDLPETLTVCIVPVAFCRMISLRKTAEAINAFDDLMKWYELLPHSERRNAVGRFSEYVTNFPKMVVPIEQARHLTQYDIEMSDDLILSSWMMEKAVGRVSSIYRQLSRLAI